MSLPNEYIELEYIQSSGTQYIRLPFGFDKTDEIEIVGAIANSGTDKFLISPQTWNTNKNKFAMLGTYSNLLCVGYGDEGTSDSTLSPHISISSVLNTKITQTYKNYIFSCNGSTLDVSSRTFGGTTTNLKLFYGYNANTAGRIYELIYKKTSTNYHFIPVIRRSDLTIGLYDLANNEFYTNSGTGSFLGKFKETPQPSGKPFDIVFFYPNGTIQYDVDKSWDYNEKKLFDTWEMLSNVQIVKQDEDTNVVAIYNQDGTTLRGAYTILNDGTIEQITDGVAIPNRVGSNKTKYVFDSNNNVLDLAKANLPNLQYNHKITFNINFDGEYKFDDFNLAQPIKFYSTKDNTLFNSILTAWKYDISQNSDVIQNATFTLGKVRDALTDKVMKIRNNR